MRKNESKECLRILKEKYPDIRFIYKPRTLAEFGYNTLGWIFNISYQTKYGKITRYSQFDSWEQIDHLDRVEVNRLIDYLDTLVESLIGYRINKYKIYKWNFEKLT